jgi:hypothetical protein
MAALPEGGGKRGHPLTDHLVEGRSCGPCIGCCSIYQIPTLNKPKYVLCTHCTGTSCTIYDDRPQECRTFYCLWRRIAAMPEEARPDKIGIVFTYEMYDPPPNPFQKRYIIGRAIGDPAVFDTAYGRAAVNMFIREGSLPVFIAYKDETKMVYPDAAFSRSTFAAPSSSLRIVSSSCCSLKGFDKAITCLKASGKPSWP